MKRLLLTAMILLLGALITPAYAHCDCCDDDIHIWLDIDWGFWDWDCCCCCDEVWYLPFWAWPDCCRRVVTIYYSPCGWYRYYYYDYPCWGCERVYVERRWVYRRAVRLERQYSHTDMIRELNTTRRRGSGLNRLSDGSSNSNYTETRPSTRGSDGALYKPAPERSKNDVYRTPTRHSSYETHSTTPRSSSDSRPAPSSSSKSRPTKRSK